MANKDLLIIKTLFLTYVFYVSKACATTTRVQPARALEINCENFKPWREDLDDWHEDVLEEMGEICQFNVTQVSPQELWIMNNFSCGASSRRIVMCEKAFDLFIKAGEMLGYQSAHHDPLELVMNRRLQYATPLDHARVRRDIQNTESERSEEFHIQPTLLLGLALTTSILFNLFLVFYIYRKSLFVSLPQDIKVLA